MLHSPEVPVSHMEQPSGALHTVSHSICLVRMFHLAELDPEARLTLRLAVAEAVLPMWMYMW